MLKILADDVLLKEDEQRSLIVLFGNEAPEAYAASIIPDLHPLRYKAWYDRLRFRKV